MNQKAPPPVGVPLAENRSLSQAPHHSPNFGSDTSTVNDEHSRKKLNLAIVNTTDTNDEKAHPHNKHSAKETTSKEHTIRVSALTTVINTATKNAWKTLFERKRKRKLNTKEKLKQKQTDCNTSRNKKQIRKNTVRKRQLTKLSTSARVNRRSTEAHPNRV